MLKDKIKIFLSLIVDIIFTGNAYASSQQHGVHHQSAPFLYYLQWGVLLLIWFFAVKYLRKRFKRAKVAVHALEHAVTEEEEGAHHGIHVVKEAIGLSRLFCLVVIFLFFSDYAASLHGYHEGVATAILKFAVRFSLGIGLTAFGIFGMDEH
ncbi:MAG: hypothetical protein HZA78_06675 [Candidatus Schekmanbacteria bacterium]|nr:hypothetical protein [Candidatus Schekmanbacteria bacterium]